MPATLRLVAGMARSYGRIGKNVGRVSTYEGNDLKWRVKWELHASAS